MALIDLLQEGAHLHGIKYNNYLAGGTTDHVSFLEVNNGLTARPIEIIRRLLGNHSEPPVRISAAALVAMLPGKASPLVYGGKIHTRNDVPARVYPEPLREALLLIDYAFYVLDGGERVVEPRNLDRFHYARLYEVNGSEGKEYWLALKDAIEPNRRNLNEIYLAKAVVNLSGKEAFTEALKPVGWGVETRLKADVTAFAREHGVDFSRVRIRRMTLEADNRKILYERRLNTTGKMLRMYDRCIATLERLMGRFSFLTYFAVAYLLVILVNSAINFLMRFDWFLTFLIDYSFVSVPAIVIAHLGALLYFMVRKIPTWIDNHYRHENRADNLGSLRRKPSNH